jgi:hypothetical protein
LGTIFGIRELCETWRGIQPNIAIETANMGNEEQETEKLIEKLKKYKNIKKRTGTYTLLRNCTVVVKGKAKRKCRKG